jgi:hypothetical protein
MISLELPQDDACEQMLLSCCLLDEGKSLDACIGEGVTVATFANQDHRSIYRKLLQIRKEGKPIDLAVLIHEARADKEIDLEAFSRTMREITLRGDAAVGFSRWLSGCREVQLRREIIESCVEAIQRAKDYTGPDDLPRLLEGLKKPQERAESGLGGWMPTNAAKMWDEPTAAPPELIHGMLYCGGTMMMSGASKSMKTYTMIAAGLAVATGAEWLGQRCSRYPVLYLNLELQAFAMEKRVREIASAMRVDCPANFHVLNLRGQLVNIDAIEAQLSRLLAQINPGLVIIDPHYKISAASGVEENSNDAQGLLLYRLENTVCKRNAALMIAHHFSKGDKSQSKAIDRAAGGGALARWPDVIMTLTEHEEEGCCAAEFSLRNFAPIDAYVLKWEYPLWKYVEGADPSKLKKPGRPTKNSPDSLIELVPSGGITRSNLAKEAETNGWGRSACYDAIKGLIRAGKLKEMSGCIFAEK